MEIGVNHPVFSPAVKAVLVACLLTVFALGGCVDGPGDKPAALSADQAKIIDAFGYPDQFIISYLPQNKGDESFQLARFETWFYHEHKAKLSFLAGRSFAVDRWRPPRGTTAYPRLKPQDFYYSMGYDEVMKAAGGRSVAPVAFVNDLFKDEGLKSYQGRKLAFTLEGGRLTYFQTLGVKRR